MTIAIRLANAADALLIHRLTQLAFDEYRGQLQPPSSAHNETEAVEAEALRQGGAVLAFDADLPVGAARFRPQSDHLYIGRVSVLPSRRGEGVALALMLGLEDQARRLGVAAIELEVRESLPSNVRLYEKLGYGVIRRAPHPRDADFISLRMRKAV